MTPVPRSSLRASATTSAGGLSFDGRFTRSRAHVTASPMVAPRSTAALTGAPPAAMTVTFFSFDGVALPLYSRYW